jgi:hypothetical protein
MMIFATLPALVAAAMTAAAAGEALPVTPEAADAPSSVTLPALPSPAPFAETIASLTGVIAMQTPGSTDAGAAAPASRPGAGQSETAAAPQTASPGSSGLPLRQPPPRTLAAFWPVFVGFALAMAGIVAFLVLGVGGRQARLVEAIQRVAGSEGEGAGRG